MYAGVEQFSININKLKDEFSGAVVSDLDKALRNMSFLEV